MKDDHEDDGMTNPPQQRGPPGRSQRQPKKENNNNNNEEGGESKKQGEGEKTAPSGATSTTGSALVGTRFGMRLAFDEQQHTTRRHRRRRGTQQGREGHKHTPDPGNNQGQPWKGRRKQKANTPESRPTEAATVGRGTNKPLKAKKDTKDLTQPSLPGDATDQPNPNTKTQYREGPKGINKSQPERSVQSQCITVTISMSCVTQSVNCIHSSSRLRH